MIHLLNLRCRGAQTNVTITNFANAKFLLIHSNFPQLINLVHLSHHAKFLQQIFVFFTLNMGKFSNQMPLILSFNFQCPKKMMNVVQVNSPKYIFLFQLRNCCFNSCSLIRCYRITITFISPKNPRKMSKNVFFFLSETETKAEYYNFVSTIHSCNHGQAIRFHLCLLTLYSLNVLLSDNVKGIIQLDIEAILGICLFHGRCNHKKICWKSTNISLADQIIIIFILQFFDDIIQCAILFTLQKSFSAKVIVLVAANAKFLLKYLTLCLGSQNFWKSFHILKNAFFLRKIVVVVIVKYSQPKYPPIFSILNFTIASQTFTVNIPLFQKTYFKNSSTYISSRLLIFDQFDYAISFYLRSSTLSKDWYQESSLGNLNIITLTIKLFSLKFQIRITHFLILINIIEELDIGLAKIDFKKENQMNQQSQLEQAQSSSSVTPPIKSYKTKSRQSKKPLHISYFTCPYCKISYKRQKERCKRHIRQDCQKRKIAKKNKQRLKQHIQNIQVIARVSNQLENKDLPKKNKKISKILSQVNILKAKVNALQNTPGKNFKQRKNLSKELSKQILNQTIQIIKPQLEHKICQQIEDVILYQKIEPNLIHKTFVSHLLVKLVGLKFKGMMTTWQQQFSDCIDQILSKLQKTTPQSRSRNRTASVFLKQFDEYELTVYNQKFLTQLKKSTLYKRSTVVNMYHRLQRKFPNLMLKSLPINIGVYYFTTQRPIMDINEIKAQISDLWKKDKQLACDLFFCLCMGLRKSQLLKVFICNQKKQFYKFIKVFENKNKNLTTRFIPESLIIMMLYSGNKYPMTNARFSKVRNHCLSKLKIFYGLRHCCLTNLTIGMLKNSGLNIHRRANTTISRYVNMELCGQISLLFKIQGFTEQDSKRNIVYTDSHVIFNQAKVQIFEEKNVQVKLQFYDEEQEQLQDQINDSNLSHEMLSQVYYSSQVSQGQKVQLKLQSQIYQQYNQQILSEGYSTQVDVMNRIIDVAGLDIQELSSERSKVQKTLSYNTQMENIGKALKSNIRTLQYAKDLSSQIIQQYKHQNIPIQNWIIIAKSQEKLQISQVIDNFKDIQPKQYRQRILRTRTRGTHNKYNYQAGLPYCVKCFKCYLQRKKKILQCPSCKYQTKKTNFNRENLKAVIKITTQNKLVSRLKHKSIRACLIKNNLQFFVQGKYGVGSYNTIDTFYGTQMPQLINTQVIQHSEFTSKQIRYNQINEMYLPLQIKKSNIEQAGMGMFCTQNIQPNEIIITYSGVIRTNLTVDQTNDSNFLLGALVPVDEGDDPFQLLIQPSIKLNAARYINSGQKDGDNNAASILGIMLGQKDQSCRIILYIYSTKQIKSGEQIYYKYGDLYQFNSEQEECL